MTSGSSTPRRVARRTLAVAAFALAAGGIAGSGCAQEPIEVSVRSLERSGRAAFLCLGDPSLGPGARRPIGDCQSTTTDSAGDYSVPHLYALVTQMTRGEVALIDLTTTNPADAVIDQNRRVPGANFLPVGAQPVDIAATPGGTATFVAVAEVGREGIFVLPSELVRPASRAEQPTLSSWRACSLGGHKPGSILVLSDPPDEFGDVRRSCDGPYQEAEPNETANPDDTGRLKLLVTLPEEGGFAVLDAQQLIEQDADEAAAGETDDFLPGNFVKCPIERWVPLEVDLSDVPAPPPTDPGPACVDPPVPAATTATFAPRPAGVALSGKRLYIADLDAPVIHTLDLPTPCEPVERPPLLPTSLERPERAVTTSRIAVSPGQTPDYKRYLYAIDHIDGSTMVFDVSEDGTASRTPLVRDEPGNNPFAPRDRIRYGPPARDVVIVERDVPAVDSATGVAQTGVLCDPDPDCVKNGTCPAQAPLYRTSADYTAGAGPLKLRGTFAFVLLSNGQIRVVDIDDYDAPCRGPRKKSALFGCEEEGDKVLATSGEVSCRVVVPHTPRIATYLISNDAAPRHEPGLQSVPQLHDNGGALVAIDNPGTPRMRATVPESLPTDVHLALAIGAEREIIDAAPTSGGEPGTELNGILEREGNEKVHALAMNFDDPRAHVSEEEWTVTYEGALPGFGTRFAELRIGTGPEDDEEGLFDATSRFCDAGVQSQTAVAEILGTDPGGDLARSLADRVQIASDLPAEGSPHWQVAGCGFQECRSQFGTKEVPNPGRDLTVVEAYQDRLVLADHELGDELVKCCFPGVVSFNVRPGDQWVVVGSGTGFFHHVIEGPDGRCRNSCDPAKSRLNGRVRTAPGFEPVRDSDPAVADPLVSFAFMNPMFRFAITQCTSADLCDEPRVVRGYQFQFQTIAAFVPVIINLAGEGDIAPQAMTVVPANGRLAVTDGTLEGLILVAPERLDVFRTYF